MIGTKVAQSLLRSVLNCCKIAITLIFLGPLELIHQSSSQLVLNMKKTLMEMV